MLLTALFHTACLSTPALSARLLRLERTFPHFKLVFCVITSPQKHVHWACPLELSLSWQRYEIPQSRGRYLNSPQFRVSTCFCLLVFVRRPDIRSRLNWPFFLRPGRSSLFPIDDNLLDDGHGNQGVPGVLGSPNCYPHQNGERIERFSRKVFVGGLPPDIDEGEDNITVFQGWITLLTFAFLLYQPSFFLFSPLLFLSLSPQMK